MVKKYQMTDKLARKMRWKASHFSLDDYEPVKNEYKLFYVWHTGIEHF